MALTGLQIFQMLPKKNCGECGVPTCLAFAMKLAAGQAELEACPYVTEEVKEKLAEAAAPPIRTVEVGQGDKLFKVGGEVVMYRHEKTFFNPCGFALSVEDSLSDKETGAKIEEFKKAHFDRVGQILKPDLLFLSFKSGDEKRYLTLVEKAKSVEAALVLAASPEILKKVLGQVKEEKPLIYAADSSNWEEMAGLAKEFAVPLAVKGKSLEELTDLTEKLKSQGLKDLVLDPSSRSLGETFKNLVLIRRAAIEKKLRPLGFPVIVFPSEETKDELMEFAHAATYVAKYGGVVVLSDLSSWKAYPLFVLRQNIYTDPQRPMQVEEKIYEMGSPKEDAPFLVTTNFSLTYFIVSSEVESSKIPTWLGVVDTEGLSVLTAWSAGKLTPEKIAEFVKKQNVGDKLKHKKIIIPGFVAQMLGALEDELPGFEIIVGPREAADIPAFLKQWSA